MAVERAILVGDAHIGRSPGTEREFLKFLESVPSPGDHLVITGDLFEFWFEYRTVLPRHAFGVLCALSRCVEAGVTISMIGGNHDRWTTGFWEDDLGIEYSPEYIERDIAGLSSLVVHGDGLAEQRSGSRLLHRVTRWPVTAGLFRMIHPDLGHAIVRRLSLGLSEPVSTSDKQRVAGFQAEHARRVMADREDLQLLVMAHTHVPALVEFDKGRWYLNPGAFEDGCYATIDGTNIELRVFPSGT